MCAMAMSKDDGFANDVDDWRRDNAQYGHAADPVAERDAELRLAVGMELIRDGIVRTWRVHVACTAGVVRVWGEVTAPEKASLDAALERVKGAIAIENQVTVEAQK